MQLGFVIDHSRCIGCHACTVACKAENDVPLGSFRTWVKYTERGTFPEVRRSFAVLRCNQCSDAPCVAICPVRALEKRPDGIVDVDPTACIGCKACMQGCPYDALYINPGSGTAEKCHFCAHRVERGLAPACAVVCPTEAIVPGDFHDPQSVVATMRRDGGLTARKTEAGTGPNVFYKEAGPAGLDPALTNAAGGYLWANQIPGAGIDAEAFFAAQEEAEQRARTTYDVEHTAWWGAKVSAYLLTKAIAAGLFFVCAWLLLGPDQVDRTTGVALSSAALTFLAITGVLLIADLKRPERFWTILTRPNMTSWLARGTLVLTGYGVALLGWTAIFLFGNDGSPPGGYLGVPALGLGVLLAALAAAYTGWLFAQARGRVLWMRRGLWLHLIVKAWVAGFAFALLVAPALTWAEGQLENLRWALQGGLALHLLFTVFEGRGAPRGREEEYARAARLVTHGPYRMLHWIWGIGVGIGVPFLLLANWTSPPALASAGLLALFGLLIEEDILVRAGQAPRIS